MGLLGNRRGSLLVDGSRREDALQKWFVKAIATDNGAAAARRLQERRQQRQALAPSPPTVARAPATARLATKPSTNATHENPGWLSDRSAGVTGRGGHLASTTAKPTDKLDVGMRVIHQHKPTWLRHPDGGSIRRLRDPVTDATTLNDSLDALLEQQDSDVARLQTELAAQHERRAEEHAVLAQYAKSELNAKKAYNGTRLSDRSAPWPSTST
jgi:hypothetical protein